MKRVNPSIHESSSTGHMLIRIAAHHPRIHCDRELRNPNQGGGGRKKMVANVKFGYQGFRDKLGTKTSLLQKQISTQKPYCLTIRPSTTLSFSTKSTFTIVDGKSGVD